MVPACPEVAKYPGHVGYAREQDAPVGLAVGKVQRLAIDGKVDIIRGAYIEAGGGDDDIGFQLLS